MKKILITLSILFIFSVAVIPTPTSADIKAGWTPGNFFYFLDTGFEKINLLFIFNSEKKAEKALEYANERLAEIKEIAEDNKPELVEKALAGYEEKISLATEKSKEIKDEEKAENLLSTIGDNISKHQEILESVLKKVPEEAKEAIQKAIEIAKQEKEKTDQQIQEFKSEIAELKKELEKTKKEKDGAEIGIEKVSEKSGEVINQAKIEADTFLKKEDKQKLNEIIRDMIKNGEDEDNILFVINDFKNKYGIGDTNNFVLLKSTPKSKDNNFGTHPVRYFMKQGTKGEDVCILQKILKIENVFDNSVTCYYGPVTYWAVENLMKKYGYFHTPDKFGTVDKITMDLINQLYVINKDGSIEKNLTSDIKHIEKQSVSNEIYISSKTEKRGLTLEEILGKQKQVNVSIQKVREKEIKETENNKSTFSFQDKVKSVISQKSSDLLNKAKSELEGVYTAIEIRKLDLKTELKYLDNTDHLTFIISTIEDCSISTASLLARTNAFWDKNIEETKRISQKNIDRRRAYGFEDAAILEEKELADTIKQKEKSREIDLNSIKVNCSDSLKNSLKDTLNTLKRNISEISDYTNSYRSLQKEIETELGKIETAQEKMKDGQDVDIDSVYNNYSQKIAKIILQFNSVNSEVKSKVNWADYTYSRSVDNAFETESIMQDIRSNFDSIQDKAQADYENWKIKNTPVKCWSDTNYSGGLINGKSETSIRCETSGSPIRCWSTTQYSGGINGTSNTSFRCE